MLDLALYKEIVNQVNIPFLVAEPVFTDETEKNIDDFKIVFANQAFANKAAHVDKGVMFRSVRREFSLNVDFFGMGIQTYTTGKPSKTTYFAESKGTWFDLEMQLLENRYIVVTFIDINAKKLYSEQLKNVSITDILTNLPNRNNFFSDLENVIAIAREKSTKVALFIFDIDDFKSINDSNGQQDGDRLLIKSARIVKSFENANRKVYRFGGDEFIFIERNHFDNDSLLEFGENVLNAFDKESISVSCGISVFPDDTIDRESFVNLADLAVFTAKRAGKHCVKKISEEIQQKFVRDLALKQKMPNSFENNEFYLYFQPQFDIETNKLRGFEALLRWSEVDFGNISPDEFIPIAEETGFIHKLGSWVLEKGFICQKQWEEKFNYSGVMSINVSPVQLMSDDFLEILHSCIEKTKVNPNHVELEVTEGVFINNAEKAVAILQEAKKMGFGISLDDFGTGYSSLRYLQILPLTTLKIDKSFIQTITEKDSVSEKIINAIISMVTKMGLDTIAEGVERFDQLSILAQLNCKNVQGFLRGKPMNQSSIEEYLSGNLDALDYIKS